MEKITAPFTEEQVKRLNEFQESGMHEFTCCSPPHIAECTRKTKESEGILTATTEGWICPCKKYAQDWAPPFMAEKTTRQIILDTVSDLASSFVYYDRKEDSQLSADQLKKAIMFKRITVDEIVAEFRMHMENNFGK